jgi:gamma-glutamyltranspeptidase
VAVAINRVMRCCAYDNGENDLLTRSVVAARAAVLKRQNVYREDHLNKQAFLSRGAIADSDFSDLDMAAWLAPTRMAEAAARVDRLMALPWPHDFKTGDTVFFAAVDANGRSASVL